jgi:RHS repeat-associated protein
MNRQAVNLPLPNPVTNTSYNQANQMGSFKDKNMTFDNNGNMTSVTNSCGTTNYTWDARNRLVGIDGYKPDCSPLTASFKCDALGRRIEKTVNGRTIQYFYDGLDIVQEIENGVVSANYVRTLYIDDPLARLTSNISRYYQTDALGSIIALTDENGTVKTTYSYDPFGSVTVSGEVSDNTFQYAGRENDNTGFYYYRVRYYSPELQRFISEDPIDLAGGINLYSYTHNNPVDWIDPLGFKCKRPFWGRALDNFILTNKFIPGSLAPWLAGWASGVTEEVVKITGGQTFFKWLSTGLRAATLEGVAFSRLSTGIISVATSFTSYVLTGVAWETGVVIGSIISAAILPCEEEIEPTNNCK